MVTHTPDVTDSNALRVDTPDEVERNEGLSASNGEASPREHASDRSLKEATSSPDPSETQPVPNPKGDEPLDPPDSAVREDVLAGDRSDRPTSRERPFPQDKFLIYDRLTRESTLSQDTLGFDYVRDDGVIVDGDDFVGLVEIQPRNWLVLNDAERTAVVRAFASFLLGLKYPIQLVAIPREFDISKHTELIRLADSRVDRDEESPILRHGRRRQVAWMHSTIDTMSVKDRDFYAITRVTGTHVDGSFATKGIDRRFPLIGALRSVLSPASSRIRRRKRSRSEERCVTEVRARQHELAETLTKTGVSTRIVPDRDETMGLLYRHYNHAPSPFQKFNHATYTELLSNALGAERDE